MRHEEGPRPAKSGPQETTGGDVTASVTDPWAETYRDAERWVSWTGRRRWPDLGTNDQIWAMSVTSWWHGGRSGRAA